MSKTQIAMHFKKDFELETLANYRDGGSFSPAYFRTFLCK